MNSEKSTISERFRSDFAEDLNVAMMKAVHAKWMVTKESGKAGGFEEKVSAAEKAGVGLIVIGRPVEEGIS